jgi:hypothetical protein
MKQQQSGELNLTSGMVGIVLGATAMGAYLWYMAPGRTASVPGPQETVKQRAADINSRTQLEAANHELDATNLNEIDSELTRIQVEAAF